MKIVHDSIAIGLIHQDSDESAHRLEMLVHWYGKNRLELNLSRPGITVDLHRTDLYIILNNTV